MDISELAPIITTLSTIIGAFAVLTRAIYKGVSKFLAEMARNHSELIKPIIEDARQTSAIAARMSSLEQDHKEIVTEQSHIASKLDAMSKRIDETYSLLLKHMQ